MGNFILHPQLAADTVCIGRLPLCEVRLMNDEHYPWFILVPMRANSVEVYDLPPNEQAWLWRECSEVGETLMTSLDGDKLNIATLGNMVPQLHVHVVVRYQHDAAWPGPIWGNVPAKPFAAATLAEKVSLYRSLLNCE